MNQNMHNWIASRKVKYATRSMEILSLKFLPFFKII